MKFAPRQYAVVTILALASFACGLHQHPATAQLSPEGKTAVYGREVIAGVKAAADGVDTLMTTKVLPEPDGIAVLKVFREVGVQSQHLADALDIIDQAKDPIAQAAGVKKAQEAIKAIQKGVASAVVPVGSADNRAKIIALLSQLNDALTGLAFVLPRLQPAS